MSWYQFNQTIVILNIWTTISFPNYTLTCLSVTFQIGFVYNGKVFDS